MAPNSEDALPMSSDTLVDKVVPKAAVSESSFVENNDLAMASINDLADTFDKLSFSQAACRAMPQDMEAGSRASYCGGPL